MLRGRSAAGKTRMEVPSTIPRSAFWLCSVARASVPEGRDSLKLMMVSCSCCPHLSHLNQEARWRRKTIHAFGEASQEGS
jgi:hypothetical protein